MHTAMDLLAFLQPGCVYRRSDLTRLSNKSIGRILARLVDAQILVKVWRGIYHYPKSSRFGILPSDPDKLVKAFLQSDDFLIVSPNGFNGLRVGTTQLYNCLWVYNRKRGGRFELGGQVFEFFRKRNFPKKVTSEILLVELVNNLNNLPENREEVRSKTLAKLQDMCVRFDVAPCPDTQGKP